MGERKADDKEHRASVRRVADDRVESIRDEFVVWMGSKVESEEMAQSPKAV